MPKKSSGEDIAVMEPVEAFDSFAYAATAKPRSHLSAPEFAQAPTGSILGFELVRELGRGSFSRVYLATQSTLAGRPVALKVAKEIGAEIETLGQLRHTNVVPVYSRHEGDDVQAICMPYLGDVTLQHVLSEMSQRSLWPTAGADFVDSWRKRQSTVLNHLGSTVKDPARDFASGTPSPARPGAVKRLPATFERLATKSYVNAVLEIVAALADGLGHAHDRGILHRDLKPSNVLLTDEGEPMLMDFNLAEDMKRAHVAGPTRGGTLPYASPEQIDEFLGRTVALDERSDLYSLGVMLYEMLTGKLPFEPTTGPDAWHSARALRETAPSPSDGLNRAVTRRTAIVVEKCLALRPAARYQSARELREDLLCCLNDKPLVHALDPAPSERLRRWAERRRRGLGAAAIAMSAAAVLLVANAVLGTAAQRDAAGVWNDAKAAFQSVQLRMAAQVTLRQDFPKARAELLQALAPYNVAGDLDWFSGPRVAWLSAGDKARLREQATMALLMLAEAASVEARAADGASRTQFLADAKRWLDRAASAFRGEPLPKAVLLQQASVAALENAPEAEALASLAAGEPLDASDRLLCAVVHTTGRRFGPALDLLQTPLRRETKVVADYLAGLCYRETENYAAALACLERCSEADPHNVDFHRMIGFMYALPRSAGAIPRTVALDHLATAHKLEPRNLEVVIARLRMLEQLGEVEAALAELATALEWSDSKVHLYWAAQKLVGKSGPERAAEFKRKSMGELPNSAVDWFARSRFLHDAKQSTEALAAASEAWKLQPWRKPIAMYYRILLKAAPGREADADAVGEKLSAIFPDIPQAR